MMKLQHLILILPEQALKIAPSRFTLNQTLKENINLEDLTHTKHLTTTSSNEIGRGVLVP